MTAQIMVARCPRCNEQSEGDTVDELLNKIRTHSENCRGDTKR